MELDPRHADAYSNRGNAYKRKGEPVRAIQDYNRSLELDPRSSETYYNRGNAHTDLGDPALAVQDYSKALEMSEGEMALYARYSRGIAWLRLGEWEKARSDLAITGNVGLNLATAFRSLGYADITAFEQENDVKLPEDIAAMLMR